jgi:peptide/nickel transport system substrate-binding protein
MVDQRVQELIFDRLFYRSAITSDLKSRLVNGFEVFDGGRRVKLELRTDVRWHDGEPLGPEDVCFTVAAMLDRRTPSQMAEPYRDVLAGCDVSEPDHAAVIEFTRPVHDARDWLSFLVVPAHAFATTALQPDDRFSVQPIGTGPMQGRLARRQVMLESFDNPHHQAHIRSVRISEGGDPYVQVRTTLSAGVHGMVSVAPPLRADIAASNDVALKSYDLRSWWFVAVDTRSGPLADVRIRQALDRSLDRNELRELTVGVDPHDPNPPVELVSGPFVPYSAYYNRTVQPRPHADLDDVRQLMEAAGATQQAGRWLLDGKPIELRIGMDAALNNEARDLLNQVGNQLQVAGFGRQVYKIPHDEWATEVVTGRMADRYDLLIGKWSFGSVENVSDLFHTRDAQGRGERNLFDYSDPTVDALLTRHDQATTDTEAQDAYHELHAHLAEQLPYLFLWKLDTKSAWRSEVRHNTITPYYYFTEFDGWQLR